MPTAIDVPTGKWVRYSKYEIRAGYIRPAARATIEEYDPWADYQAASATRQGQPPYQSLLELVRTLRLFSNAEDDDRIAGWCADHGLLGVLPQCAAQVIFPPRMEPVFTEGHWIGEGEKRTLLAPASHRFIRTGLA